MLDIKFIRENLELVKKATKSKGIDPTLVDKLLELDSKRRVVIQKAQELLTERNKIAKDQAIKLASETLKKEEHKVTTDIIKRAVEIKDAIKKQKQEEETIENDYRKLLLQIPNPPTDDVKTGKDETENEVLRKWGEQTKFDFTPKDHLVLGEALGIIDVERAAKVSGARFSYLRGDAVLLEFALVQFALKTLIKEGFLPVIPPVLIKTEMMKGMGYMEHGGDEQMYIFDKDGLVLVGTSEQSLGPQHANEILDVKKLPLRYMGFSTCFRREAGTYGKDTRGIIRVHQFDKVEMFSFVKPEDGDKEHEFLLSIEEKLLQALKIPYQVVKMCSGDLGVPAARKYDLEAWMPGQEKYREVTSTSTTTDFQSRRLNIKYREGDKADFVHTLNGTALAIGRTIVAILENYQQKDGSVVVPEVLQDFMGKEKI